MSGGDGGPPGLPPGGGGGRSDGPNSTVGAGLRALEFVVAELVTAGVGLLAVWLGARVMRRVLDPNADARNRARARRELVINRLCATGVPLAALESLSPAEENLLHDLIFPEDIHTTFAQIGGMEKTKEALREIIIYPLLYPSVYGMGPDAAGSSGCGSGSAAPSAGDLDDPDIFGGINGSGSSSRGRSAVVPHASLLAPPKGVLLYGPPGTGKTLLASAIAKESGANFLVLSPSSMLSKWLGETEQLARAVFSLARRVQPTVVFIDEIDGLFRERSSTEHEAHKNLKSEFMQLWDGLSTDHQNMIIVLGATNRPYDVDPAILRRMPRAFEVGVPNQQERTSILRKILTDAELEPNFSFEKIARITDGYSGSDLKELCRAAMMQPVREALRATAKAARVAAAAAAASSSSSSTRAGKPGASHTDFSPNSVPPARLRPLEMADVVKAREEIVRTESQSQQYWMRSLGAQHNLGHR